MAGLICADGMLVGMNENPYEAPKSSEQITLVTKAKRRRIIIGIIVLVWFLLFPLCWLMIWWISETGGHIGD